MNPERKRPNARDRAKLSQFSSDNENQLITNILSIGEAIEVTKNKINNITRIFLFEKYSLLNDKLKLLLVRTKNDTIPQHKPIIRDKAIFTGLSEIR